MYKVISIDAPHFNAGVVCERMKDGDGDLTDQWYVSDAAPILRYMMGWRPESVVNYCHRKGWTFTMEEVSDE